MEVRVLGPVELWCADTEVPAGPPKQRCVLAVLALNAGQPVPADLLVDRVWGERPPGAVTSSLHSYVTRLRRLLAACPAGGEPSVQLALRGGSYLLTIDPARVDVLRARGLVQQAGAARRAGRDEEAAALLRQALAGWRGQPLAGLPGDWAGRMRAALAQERLQVLIDCFDVELRLGHHARLTGELAAAVAEYPLAEPLVGQLMRALYGGGRGAEALDHFAEARRRIREELGAELGPALVGLHQRILRGDPALTVDGGQPLGPADGADAGTAAGPQDSADAGTPAPGPAQLPADIADFTGRQAEVAELVGILDTAHRSTPVVISAIEGTGGVGKSSLAIHVAHRLADRFPDGQLYANLHGATSGVAPVAPVEVLGRWLRALGVEPGGIPGEVEEAAARFRSQVADRRMLVVLDDAVDVAQVLPLLPGAPGCGVMITSRRSLAGLPGATHVPLNVLDHDEAVALLARLAGADRVSAEPQAAAELAALCGYLPLALRIVGARLAVRPGWPLSAFAARLADAQTRLDELDVADIGVRASFAVSHRELAGSEDPVGQSAAAAFPLLGLLDGPDFGVPVAARLLDLPEPRAMRVLDRLVDTRLLEAPAPGRYRFHDLLRLYARELVGRTHPEVDRTLALTRAIGCYVATAWNAFAVLRPDDHRLADADPLWWTGGLEFADAAAALHWLETERPNLTAAVAQAAQGTGRLATAAPQLAHALFGFCQVRGYNDDWVAVNELAIVVAARTGERAVQARAHNDLGLARLRQGRHELALAALERSLELYRDLGDRAGEAASLNGLSRALWLQGRYDEAVTRLHGTLATYRLLDDPSGQARTLGNLGVVYERQGRYDEALACHRESLAIFDKLGNRHGYAITLTNIGSVYELLERHAGALEHQRQSLAIFRELGDRHGQAETLKSLGIVHSRLAQHAEALASLGRARTIYRDLGDPYGEAETLRELGAALLAMGRPEEARPALRQALEAFRRVRAGDADEVQALLSTLDGG